MKAFYLLSFSSSLPSLFPSKESVISSFLSICLFFFSDDEHLIKEYMIWDYCSSLKMDFIRSQTKGATLKSHEEASLWWFTCVSPPLTAEKKISSSSMISSQPVDPDSCHLPTGSTWQDPAKPLKEYSGRTVIWDQRSEQGLRCNAISWSCSPFSEDEWQLGT